MRKSKLIKDTTREERIRIVAEALSNGDDCEGVSSQSYGVQTMYEPYINGELELRECNMRGAAHGYVQSDHARPSTGASCMMGL